MPATIDITPSPRVLRMLGQIDFAPWQCLAELIDNSIDAFLDAQSEDQVLADPKISISLPTDQELRSETGFLEVRDNGLGMQVDELSSSVKAGYSGNDPVEKMGLFGMGFNISTARLGRRTEVWTTTKDSGEWTGIVIDFDELEKTKTFSAPLQVRDKDQAELENGVHGTRVKITKLDPTRIRPLIWGSGKANTRRRLGKIYGRVMRDLDISITYDGDIVSPWRHIVWGASRSVPNSDFGTVHARIEINESLPPRRFCTTCWVWLADNDEDCPACGLTDQIIERQRSLKGWVGLQRYFDKEHYGFDLIRNGRVIEELDKSMFTFVDSAGDNLFEYPRDGHWGGRIVGELEIDFVRVSHQKDSFDKLDPEWRQVISIVRGNSPVQPMIARRMGLEHNDSPLARLFSAFRTTKPGLQNLVPGNSSGALNTGAVMDYKERFYNDEGDYQDDEKWFELVKQGERVSRGGSKGGDKAAGGLPIGGQVGKESPPDDEKDSEEKSRTAPVQLSFENDLELSRTFEMPMLPGSPVISVAARQVKGTSFGKPFVVETNGYQFKYDYDLNSPYFEESLESPLDSLLTDLAYQFLAVSAETPRNWPVSIVERELRKKYYPETLSELSHAVEASNSLLSEIRMHYDQHLPDSAPLDAALVDKALHDRIRRRAISEDLVSEESINEIITSGQFAKYVDNRFLGSLVETWPHVVTDSQLFDVPYDNVSEDLRPEVLAMLVNALEDVRWLAEEGSGAVSKDHGWKLRYGRAVASLRLAQSWRS
jgi:hypothetical protein